MWIVPEHDLMMCGLQAIQQCIQHLRRTACPLRACDDVEGPGTPLPIKFKRAFAISSTFVTADDAAQETEQMISADNFLAITRIGSGCCQCKGPYQELCPAHMSLLAL